MNTPDDDTTRLSQRVTFDDTRGLLRINGIDVSGELLEALTVPSKPGHWFRVVRAEDGRATIMTRRDGEVGEPHHKLDNDRQVFFYEQDFYVLSNFSSFSLQWCGHQFPTSEHAYHWAKFTLCPSLEPNFVDAKAAGVRQHCARQVVLASSAHEAFKLGALYKEHRRPDWDAVKVGIMRDLLRMKAAQHQYVRRKLLETGDRELIEDSWRDDYWGWGPNRDGQNMLGKLWMEVRAELRAEVGQ